MNQPQPAPGEHTFTVTDSTILVEAPIIALRRDQVVMPNGSTAAREIVEHFGAVAVVAVNDRDEIGLVHQWRQPVGRRLWELPAGLLDSAGENPRDCALRELHEELGYRADSLELLCDIVSSPGFCDEAIRVYLARGLHPVDKLAADDEEQDLVVHFLPVDDVHRMLTTGDIVNSIAMASLFRALDVLAGRSTPLQEDDHPFTLRPRRLADRRAAIVGEGGDMKQPARS